MIPPESLDAARLQAMRKLNVELQRYSVSGDHRGTMVETDWGEFLAYDPVTDLVAALLAEVARLQSALHQQELVNTRLRTSWAEDVGEARKRAEQAEQQVTDLTAALAEAQNETLKKEIQDLRSQVPRVPRPGFFCELCNHVHTNERLGHICVGCPCPIITPRQEQIQALARSDTRDSSLDQPPQPPNGD